MKNPFKQSIWSLLNTVGIGGSVQLLVKSSLREKGWFKSFHTKRSVDAAGNPIPWYTYSFIAFLTPRVKSSLTVFEYGAGNSTLWYAARVRSITAVENDPEWYQLVKEKMPNNAEVIYKELGEQYNNASSNTSKTYDIIVVDGRDRVACTKASVKALTPVGVLILDNSEREIYQEAKEFMASQGFKRLDFYGMTPIVAIESCTSVFYRPDNCLGI